MIRIPVDSSNVVSVGHEGTILEVEFKTGVYHYLDVPRDVFDLFLISSSKGQFLNANVKPHFVAVKQ